jgi:hypothetical protein
MLLHGFPISPNTDHKTLIGAYLIACEGQTIPAMLAACKAYIQGKVKRDNHTFAPSAAEFAEQVRYQQAVIDAANRPRIEKPKERAPTPQENEALTHKLRLFNQMQKGDQQAKQELQKLVSFDMDDVTEIKRVLAR